MTPIAPTLNDPNVIQLIPPDQLELRPQVRRMFDLVSLNGLAENIKRHGVLQPILAFVDAGKAVVIDGERRVRASIIAVQSRVPVRILTDPLDIGRIRARQLAANLQREDLNPVEEAEGIQSFMTESGLNAQQAAAELGLSESRVCRTLSINDLSDAHKVLVASGKIAKTSACLLVRVTDPAHRDELVERVAGGKLTRDALAAQVQQWEAAQIASPKPVVHETAVSSAARPKAAVWRMTRSIGLGVALAVTGTGLTLEELVVLLDAFIVRAREAIANKVPVARFLSEFRYDAQKGAVS